MTENFKKYLIENFQLQEDLVVKLADLSSIKKYPKKEYFVRTGEICTKIAFIIKGAMCCAYNKNGTDKIDEFSFENEFITDYFSFLSGTPADKSIVCLEECELLIFDKTSLEKLYKDEPRFERLGRLMAERLFINWNIKAKSLVLEDAETRYFKLIENKPNLAQRVPQYMIASYLNVSPETISRIRKNASQKFS